MLRRDRASLLDILEQIRVIDEHLDGVTRKAFHSDILRQDAVMRRIEIIGEATTRLSDAFRTSHSEIDWHAIRRMRNLLIHVYDKVKYGEVWDTTQLELPPLQRAVQRILDEETT